MCTLTYDDLGYDSAVVLCLWIRVCVRVCACVFLAVWKKNRSRNVFAWLQHVCGAAAGGAGIGARVFTLELQRERENHPPRHFLRPHKPQDAQKAKCKIDAALWRAATSPPKKQKTDPKQPPASHTKARWIFLPFVKRICSDYNLHHISPHFFTPPASLSAYGSFSKGAPKSVDT